MNRIGILFHPLKDEAIALAKEVEDFLKARRLSVWVHSAWDWEKAAGDIDRTDLILTIGGDGTILRAAQAAMPRGIPITGINLGRLGFMTELSVKETFQKLPALLEGKGRIDERSLLDGELAAPDEPPRRFKALNDIVVARGGVARVIAVDVTIDGAALTTYKADGVVVATATGSTGYALAAGGPILDPQSGSLVIVPILPHLSYRYPMVLPPEARISLKLNTYTPAIMSVDGHINIPLASGAMVTVRHSGDTVRFLRVHQGSFFGSLEERLRGKQSSDQPGKSPNK